MKKNCVAAIVLAVLSAPSWAQVYGVLGNFDVVDDTGKTAHGFEVDLKGLHATDITDTFGGAGRGFPTTVERYGSPTITEWNNGGSDFGVKVIYQANFVNGAWDVGTPSGTVPTPNDSCWTGGTPLYGPSYPCDHFGVGTSANPTQVNYYWLTETSPSSSTLVPVEAMLPAPVWTVTPQPAPAPGVAPPPPIVQAVVAAPPPNAYEFGPAKWVKVYTTELEGPVALEELVADNAKIKQAKANTEIEWQLLQVDFNAPGSGQLDLGGNAAVGAKAQSVVRRFEYYEYTGSFDPETYEALPVNGDSATPAPGDLGKFLGAQNDGINLNGVYVPPAAVAPTINTASLAGGVAGVAYTQAVASVAGNAGDTLVTTVSPLPAGLSFDGTNITGVPSALGTTQVVVLVKDTTNSTSATVTLPLTVVDPGVNLTVVPTDAAANAAYSYTLAATGGYGAITYSATGLPAGLSIVNNTIVGTPTTVGAYPITVTATDSLGAQSAPAAATLNVLALCADKNRVISSVNKFWLDIAGGISNGGQSVYYAPKAGTTFVAPVANFAAGEIVSYSGVANAGFCVANTMTVSAGLGMNALTLAAGQVGVAYPSTKVVPTGGVVPYTVKVAGLPNGLSFSGGAIAGTPALGANNTYPVVVTITDAIGEVYNANLTLTINAAPALAITSSNIPATATVGVAYAATEVASGGVGALTWSATGLPAGVAVSSAGVISGKPTTAGTYNVVLTVADAIGQTLTVKGSVVVSPSNSASCAKPAGATGGLNSKGTITAISGNLITFKTSKAVVVTVTVPACATIQWNGGAKAFALGQVFEWNGYSSAATGNVAQSVVIN